MDIASRLRRDSFAVEDGPDDVDEIRVYYDPQGEMPPAPSVSVIKALREDPDKEDMLEGWRQRYDGKSQWARPWFKDQKFYKGYRGTLVHFAILSALADKAVETHADSHNPALDTHLDASGDTYYHTVGDDGWGYEEYYAEYCLKQWSNNAPSANTDEIRSPQHNQYDGEHAWDRAVREMRWATQTFKTEFLDTGAINPANVLAVEEFVCQPQHGYAGQFDLLYERDGETILADLKTSSGIRFDHKLQAAAYVAAAEHCLDVAIDSCEIIRLYPDDEETEVSHSDDWDRTIEGLQHQFYGLADEAQQVAYTETLQQAQAQLASTEEMQAAADTTDDDSHNESS
jgi:hypothetical protein